MLVSDEFCLRSISAHYTHIDEETKRKRGESANLPVEKIGAIEASILIVFQVIRKMGSRLNL